MQHTAYLAVAAVVITLSTALPTPTSGGGDDVSGELISDLSYILNSYGSALETMVENLDKTEKKMTSLEEKINEQQSIIKEQAAELKTQAEINEKLTIFDTKMNASISEIEDDVRNKTEDLKEEMTQLKSDVTSQKDDIQQLGKDNTQRQNEIASIKNVNNDQARKLGQLETNIKTEERTNTAQASQLTKLATPQYFSVYLTSSKIVRHDKVLVFDGVTDDPENLYNKSTGVFECKVPGVYVFTLTAARRVEKPEPNKTAWLGIYLNGQKKASALAKGNFDQGSNTVTLTLRRGDKVTVRGVFGSSDVPSRPNWRNTSFTGRLVTPAK